MPTNNVEAKRREKIAFAAVKRALNTEEIALFVSHHLEEIEGSYWQRHLGSTRPETSEVLDILELRSHWGDEDDNGIDVFDFTLPEGITNYVISVRFDEEGEVEEISMES